jgi:hypothetical protein
MKCPAPAAPPAPPVPRCRAAASHTRNRSDLFVAARLNPYRIRPDSRRQRKAKWDHFVAARLNPYRIRPDSRRQRKAKWDHLVAARHSSAAGSARRNARASKGARSSS